MRIAFLKVVNCRMAETCRVALQVQIEGESGCRTAGIRDAGIRDAGIRTDHVRQIAGSKRVMSINPYNIGVGKLGALSPIKLGIMVLVSGMTTIVLGSVIIIKAGLHHRS